LNGLTELLATTFNGHYAMSGTRTIGAGSTITYLNAASSLNPTTDFPTATPNNAIVAGNGTNAMAMTISGTVTINTFTVKNAATVTATATTGPTITTFNINNGGKYI